MVKYENSVEQFLGSEPSLGWFAAKFSKKAKYRYFADFSDFCQILPQKSW